MPKAAFCSECHGYVWVAPDGGCMNGHPGPCLRDFHDAVGPLPPLPGHTDSIPAPVPTYEPPPLPPTCVGAITADRVDILGRRAGAFALDWIIGQTLTYHVGRMLASALSGGATTSGAGVLWLVMTVPISLALLYGYFFAFEAALGFTPGKLIFRIRVVNSQGRRISCLQALKRNAARVVDLILWGGVGFALVSASPLRQRLGDRWGETFVVRV